MLKTYEDVIKSWDKDWGPKPTQKNYSQVVKNQLAREGTKTAFALAMMLREHGASQVQIKGALGSTYRNRMEQLEDEGIIRVNTKKFNGQTFYNLQILSSENDNNRQDVVEEQHQAA